GARIAQAQRARRDGAGLSAAAFYSAHVLQKCAHRRHYHSQLALLDGESGVLRKRDGDGCDD
nr:hypothetical protein [Tanacetum cinerariifolium]